jgi:post-segregation antitoxin (ccd killing protein)
MTRPIEFKDLKMTTVMIERELLEEAKSRDMNLSAILREAVAEKLNREPPKRMVKKTKMKMAEDMVKQNPNMPFVAARVELMRELNLRENQANEFLRAFRNIGIYQPSSSYK